MTINLTSCYGSYKSVLIFGHVRFLNFDLLIDLGFIANAFLTNVNKMFLMIHIVRDRRVPPFYKVHEPCNMGVGL